MIRYVTTLEAINWQEVADLLHYYGLTDLAQDQIKLSFENSYRYIFALDEKNTIIGVGRAVSDGVAHATIYNIALVEAYHHQGIGKELFARLVQQLKGLIITLYTHPDTISWYEDQGMARLNTALVYFRPHEIDWMRQEKFITD